ncbi:uncharacterized protein LOC142230188 isoform X2 [Haematobia irritans]|uniref:uncharacterized protein LOC142230188 isoform X2 n=1 Tax=Haematobia irritans TaxID=7368 RepID=UPI003F4FEE40
MPTSIGLSWVDLCKPLKCRYPPCNCEKCREQRFNAKISACTDNITDSSCDDFEMDGMNYQISHDTKSQVSRYFRPANIYAALIDIFGIVAFIIMTSFTFWIIVWYYLCHFGVFIYQSGRKAQCTALIILSLLFLCIAFNAIQGYKIKQIRREQLTTSIKEELCFNPETKMKTACSEVNRASSVKEESHPQRQRGGAEMSHSLCHRRYPSKTNLSHEIKDGHKKSKSSDSLCYLCSKYHKDSPSRSDLTNNEWRRVLQKYKLYSIPSEWKTPPAFIVIIKDYLVDLFSG